MAANASLRCGALFLLLLVHKSAAGLARLIVSYEETGARNAVKTSWKAALAPHGVTVVHHSHADRFVILEGPLGGHSLEQVAGRLPGVVAVEQDHKIYLQKKSRPTAQAACSDGCQVQNQPSDASGKETLPYGVALAQAVDSPTAGAVTLLGSGVSVCVVDTGIYTAHPDLKANNITGCSKDECDVAYDQPSTADEGFHGTHVTGTIAAVRGNGQGVVGVVPHLANIYGINIFPDVNPGSQAASLAAMIVCESHLDDMKEQDPAARMVVQMSYGGNYLSTIERRTYARLYARGDMLFVAAAGNEQDTAPGMVEYPAGYDTVISVAAVDCNSTAAYWSQQNADVELAAPGVSVLSTIMPLPSTTTAVNVSSAGFPNRTVDSNSFANSGQGQVTGGLVDCGFGFSPCKAAKGKICLISRGNTTFACKVNNAAAGDCAGVLIYNNVDPPCLPLTGKTLVDTACPPGPKGYLPAAALSRGDGLKLQALTKLNTVATLAVRTNGTQFYDSFDGTSMATPHVSGIAARLWAANPSCTNAELRSALQRSAKDLGPRGRDSAYGYGLVQAQAAQALLAAQPCKGAAPLT